MKCLIAGASGLVGGHLISELAKDQRVASIISLSRREVSESQPKVKTLVVSFDSLASQPLPAADMAFCCLGTTIKTAGSPENFFKVDHDYILAFAKASLRAGAEEFFVVSAMGADANSRLFYNRVKGQTEEDLKKMGFKRLAIFQPSLLLGARKESRPMERLAQWMSPILSFAMVGPLAKSRPIEAEKVAQAMKSEALDHKRIGFKIISNAEMSSLG